MREVKDLIISYGKPHKPVSPETISRWTKDEHLKARIDISVFKAHSCRSASSGQARNAGVSVSEILLKKYYRKKSSAEISVLVLITFLLEIDILGLAMLI